MGDKNINGLMISTILIGLALLGMLNGYILMANNEGRGEIFDPYPEIQSFNLNLSSQYSENILDTANINSNLSAAYNPELAISAADQSGNAMALNLQDQTTNIWESISIFMGLIFGTVWTSIISGTILGLITLLFTYYFIRWIRSGT